MPQNSPIRQIIPRLSAGLVIGIFNVTIGISLAASSFHKLIIHLLAERTTHLIRTVAALENK